jgi:cytochrome P450
MSDAPDVSPVDPDLACRAAAWIDADQHIVDDPYPLWRELRAACPVIHEPGHGVWLVSRYDDCRSIARDTATWSSVLAAKGLLRGEDIPEVERLRDHLRSVAQDGCPAADTSALIDDALLVQADRLQHNDPPLSGEYRGLVNRWFTPARVAALEPRIRSVAAALTDALDTAPLECEFLSAFAGPLPGTVIADLLDVPAAMRAEFVEWDKEVHGNPRLFEGGDTTGHEDRSARIHAWFRQAMQDRRDAPGDDLISELVGSTLTNGEPVDPRHALVVVHTFHVGGQETTSKLLTSAMRLLASDDALQSTLRSQPDLIPAFVEEALRVQSPTQGLFRVARRAARVGDVELPAGAVVQLLWGSANRDEDVFERPDEILLDRSRRPPHLAFGHGIHLCPGNHLARLEARVAFEELLARTTWIEPAASNTFEYMSSHIMRGLRRLDLLIS